MMPTTQLLERIPSSADNFIHLKEEKLEENFSYSLFWRFKLIPVTIAPGHDKTASEV
jgi:hypothetical protein